MTETKRFHIGDILSMITGRLVSLDHMNGLHIFAEWLAGEPVWTHQLPRVMDEAGPHLREWFPDLAAADVPEDLKSVEAVAAWLATLGEQWRDVPHLPAADHAQINPILELQHMIGADKVVPVVIP